jgi:mono/diheme cytochrome c family protein
VEQKKLSDEQVVKSIKEGVIEDGKQRMKPIKGLSDDDIAAVVKYVRSLK